MPAERLTVFEFLDHLEGVKEAGRGKWIALCPVHKDTNPSLSVAVGATVPFVVRCFSCNARFEEILDAVGARAAGLA